MTNRIIDISDEPAKLSVSYSRLIIKMDGRDDMAIPFADIAALIAAHPFVSYTNAVLAGIAAAGGTFIVCNEKYIPIGMLLPLENHFIQTERFLLQANSPLPTRKRLWQQIIQCKIRNQGRLLKELHGNDRGLLELASNVRSGDTDNLEAQASRRYWTALFVDPGFHRNRDADDQNRLLNYGYAVLRAVVSRAICAAGLHPSIGLHHHNRYNAFCLADDLMEPFRPLIDSVVASWVETHKEDAPIDKETKAALLEILTHRFYVDGEERSLFDILARTASSLASVFAGERKDLILPEI